MFLSKENVQKFNLLSPTENEKNKKLKVSEALGLDTLNSKTDSIESDEEITVN